MVVTSVFRLILRVRWIINDVNARLYWYIPYVAEKSTVGISALNNFQSIESSQTIISGYETSELLPAPVQKTALNLVRIVMQKFEFS